MQSNAAFHPHTHTHGAHTHTHEHTRTLKCFCCLLLREVFHFSFCVDFSTNFRGEKRRVLMHHFLLGYCTVIILCGKPAKERHFSRSRSLSLCLSVAIFRFTRSQFAQQYRIFANVQPENCNVQNSGHAIWKLCRQLDTIFQKMRLEWSGGIASRKPVTKTGALIYRGYLRVIGARGIALQRRITSFSASGIGNRDSGFGTRFCFCWCRSGFSGHVSPAVLRWVVLQWVAL